MEASALLQVAHYRLAAGRLGVDASCHCPSCARQDCKTHYYLRLNTNATVPTLCKGDIFCHLSFPSYPLRSYPPPLTPPNTTDHISPASRCLVWPFAVPHIAAPVPLVLPHAPTSDPPASSPPHT